MGGYLTFASLGEGQASAAGQIPIDEMKRILEHLTP
jgi:3-dehydroquinate dehydratase